MTATRYRLTRTGPLKPNAQVEVLHGEREKCDESYPVTEFEPSPGKKYLVTLEIGDLDPAGPEVRDLFRSASSMLKDFFPEGSLLITTCRNGQPSVGIYELEPEE